MQIIATCLALAFSVTPAFPASKDASRDSSDSAFGLSKYYLGVSGGEAASYTAPFSNGSKTTSNAYSIYGGYTINDRFSAELSYANFGSMQPDGSNAIKSAAYGLAVVGFLSPKPDFSFFGKLGYASTNYVIENAGVAGPSNTNGNAYYGFGAIFRITKHISFRLGLDFYKLVDSGTNAMYSLSESNYGLQYKF